MDSKDNERVLLLEEEVTSLSEELAQCQVTYIKPFIRQINLSIFFLCLWL